MLFLELLQYPLPLCHLVLGRVAVRVQSARFFEITDPKVKIAFFALDPVEHFVGCFCQAFEFLGFDLGALGSHIQTASQRTAAPDCLILSAASGMEKRSLAPGPIVSVSVSVSVSARKRKSAEFGGGLAGGGLLI